MGVIIPAALMMSSKSILGVNMLKIADEKPTIMQVCFDPTDGAIFTEKIQVIVGKVYNVKGYFISPQVPRERSLDWKNFMVWD